MPLALARLTTVTTTPATGEAVGVKLLSLFGGDNTNLVVLAAVLTRRVADGVDMQS